jgi:hypothetical protein
MVYLIAKKVLTMKFTASLDTPTKLITTAVLLLPVVLVLFLDKGIWPGAILLFLLLLTYGFAPQYYALSETELQVKRLFKTVRIPFAEIRSIKLLPEAKKMRWTTIRTFGSGGFFGYFGKFWNSGLGSMTWYLRNFENVMLIETLAGTKILISPDNPEMLSALKKKLPASRQPLAA